jgi:hypothetical protein
MDFLRRHLFMIVCGAVGAAGITLMITGIRSMPVVLEEMETAQRIYRNLGGLLSQPVNLARIEAAKQRADLLLDDRNRVVAEAKKQYGYEPLVPGAFPDGDALALNEFRRTYQAKMEELLASLDYGLPATAADVDAARERIEEEKADQRESGLDRGERQALPVSLGPSHTPAGVLTKAGVHEDAVARAHIAAAQRIYCYARHYSGNRPPEKVASLEFRDAMKDTGVAGAPDPWEVWHAQLGYWIQKDVVDAIVGLNGEAAEEARRRGEDAWLGIMPVKEVISVRLSEGYIPRDGEEVFGHKPGGYSAALPPGTPETVFTHSGASGLYDVVQFTVKLVMDQRDIFRLVDRLCKNSFHTLLRVSYEAVPTNRKMVGKVYGSEPTVAVVMDFETIMLADVFRCWIPPSVCEFYEIPCPSPEECVQGEDEG